ncbi:MAG: methyltransferase domain-containing protein [Hyphomonadaceae bacterium]
MKTAHLLLATFLGGLVAACGGEPAAPAARGSEPAAETAPAGSLAWAAAGDWRLDKEKTRDAWRHPVETLTFFGLKPTDTVVEIAPGGGWYTAILGPWLKQGGGKLYAAHVDAAASDYNRRNVEAYKAAYVDKPDVYGDITLTLATPESTGLAPDGSADAVLTFRNIHNWMSGGYADKIFADAFRALKPGGVFGVVEHRLPSARDQDPRAGTGYVLESYVVQLGERAGFVLEESSEINANPKDLADHPVWMLPPNFNEPREGTPEADSYDKAVYEAIGESDRMTLRFRKPAAAVPMETPAETPAQ